MSPQCWKIHAVPWSKSFAAAGLVPVFFLAAGEASAQNAGQLGSVTVDPVGPASTNYTSLGEWNTNGNSDSWSTAYMSNTVITGGVRTSTASGSEPQLVRTVSPGPDYSIQTSTNLVDWSAAFATNSPTLPLTWTDMDTNQWPARFYRVLLGA